MSNEAASAVAAAAVPVVPGGPSMA